MRFKYIYLVASLLFLAANCKNDNGQQQVDTDNNQQVQQQPQETVTAPAFSADSAYAFVEKQVTFGPRVPGTKEHAKCADYLFNKLKSYTPNVEMQKARLQDY